MFRRRTVLLGAGALVGGSGALLGTGAFTTVTAGRTVEVETTTDAAALVALTAIDDSANSTEYTTVTDDGLLTVAIPNLNLNAVTHIDRVFQVRNNGTQPVVLYFEEVGANGRPIDLGARATEFDLDRIDQPGNNGIVDPQVADLSSPSPPEQNAGYEDVGVYVGVGDSLEVGLYVDTSDDDLTDGLGAGGASDVTADDVLMERLVVYASATAAREERYLFKTTSSP